MRGTFFSSIGKFQNACKPWASPTLKFYCMKFGMPSWQAFDHCGYCLNFEHNILTVSDVHNFDDRVTKHISISFSLMQTACTRHHVHMQTITTLGWHGNEVLLNRECPVTTDKRQQCSTNQVIVILTIVCIKMRQRRWLIIGEVRISKAYCIRGRSRIFRMVGL